MYCWWDLIRSKQVSSGFVCRAQCVAWFSGHGNSIYMIKISKSFYQLIFFYFVFLGKYGQDFGFIDDNCYPYIGETGTCKISNCTRHYTGEYHYIGGYYGACNEPLMMLELVKHGPIGVSFEVYQDFYNYKVCFLFSYFCCLFTTK